MNLTTILIISGASIIVVVIIIIVIVLIYCICRVKKRKQRHSRHKARPHHHQPIKVLEPMKVMKEKSSTMKTALPKIASKKNTIPAAQPPPAPIVATTKYSDETIQTQATQTQYDEFPSREEYKQWRKQRLSQIKVDRDEQVISGYYTPSNKDDTLSDVESLEKERTPKKNTDGSTAGQVLMNNV